MKISLFVILLTNQANANCVELCDTDWWETATTSDVLAALENGENVNGKVQSFTPLHLAVWKSNVYNVSILLENGAKINATAENSYNWTPLHVASMMGSINSIHKLLSEGAVVNVKDTEGLTPLHFAGIRGEIDIINLLIEFGADINDLKYD